MDIVKNVAEISNCHHSIQTKNMKECLIELKLLLVKNVIFQMFIIAAIEKSRLIKMIICY